jgi:outer membrane phospholipase A
MKFYIDYGTGSGNFVFEGELKEAMRAADEGVNYTQENVKIFAEDGEDLLAMRSWWGTQADDEDNPEIISYGKYGYYDAWYVF